jgi:hypothetical protein
MIDARLAPDTRYDYLIQTCDGSGNASPGVPVSVTTLASDAPGTVLNGDFEFNPLASGWRTEAFLSEQAGFQWEPIGSGRHGSRCVSIAATNLNDARWTQVVAGLVPHASYWLTGWIKGSNVVRQPGASIGANLCLMGGWEHQPDLLDGSFDWRQFSFAFTAPATGTVTVGCRLGFWSNCASGKVWFDDLALVRPTGLRIEQPRRTAGGQFEFRLVAPPLASYAVLQSIDLQSWSEALRVTATHPITELSMAPTATSACYYRARRAQ